jgi:flagellar basal-body rod protein FlgB
MVGLFDRGSVPVLEALLGFASARHRVIATNVANVDTAGYRTKDLPAAAFRRALDRAFEERGRSPLGLFEAPRPDLRPEAAPDAGPLKENGNNVDLDLEMGRLARNATVHQTAASLLAHQFAMMREAVGERIFG